MKKLMLGLFIAFGFSACSLGNDDAYMNCGTYKEVVFSGFPLLCNYSVKTQTNTPAAVAVGSQEKMDQIFTKHNNTCTVASDPNIDFTKNALVGIFAGQKPSSGYEIKISSIVENSCEIIVNYFEKQPAAGEATTPSATYPSDFALIPKTSKPIYFNKTNESSDYIVIGSFGATNTFFQINEYNYLKFQGVVTDQYEFGQYKYTATIKRGELTQLLKIVPTEILNLKGQSKTYGDPDSQDQGGIYFQLRQGKDITRISIDNIDTNDQSAEVKAFKKAIQDKITALK
ncbi:protease complex subunit PrcB family protein [Flavobacterium foetidum]|uniref:protease complex subunit PrcB family protein n=1 Tax=Flavobacterium foetidum TaxID=2026681 RepID=UPI0010752510|nr:protease complex subunit PrcB family protein [Flavobacterium foetidum]KAF2514327.1 protease complex subunit PrcB family protein [Flavobacterium foetidum]